MPYFIAGDCLDVRDRSCVEECPVDCIYEGDRKMYINPRECIDCGACEPVCPVSAIIADKSVTEATAPWRTDNAAFFSEILDGRAEPLGSPGGSGKIGPIGADTPLAIAAEANS
jgi:NAD-dependent dihydropyrimidine dehydrogenase PreA subunit